MNDVASVISNICSDDANIIFGTSVDEEYGDEIAVTVVATSFEMPPTDNQVIEEPSVYDAYDDSSPAAPDATPSKRPRKFWSRF